MSGKLVFVVDDEEMIADALAAYLESHGLAAMVLYDPAEALAASISHRPDLLLTDFKMPTMDGIALAMSITDRHPDCRVLLMTGHAHDLVPHPEFARFEFVHKPIPLADLMAKVRWMLGGREGGAADSG